MSTAETTVAKKPSNTIKGILSSDVMKSQIAAALPKHCTPERMIRAGLTAITKTPELANCTQESFFAAMLSLSQWGLEPDGRHAHLIPYKRTCQLIIDYKGYVQLCYRSGMVKSIHADVIREGDLFHYSCGEVVEHVPYFLRSDNAKPDSEGDVIAVYCRVTMEDGITKTEVMSISDVEGIRKRSASGSKGPWVTDWNEMAKKTVFRRVTKWLPLSADLRDAMDRDDDKLIVEGTVTQAPATRQGVLSQQLSMLTSEEDEPEVAPEEEEPKAPTMPQVIEEFESLLKAAKTQKNALQLLDETLTKHEVDQATEVYLEDLINAKFAK